MKTLTSSNHLIRRVSFLIMGIGLFGSLRGQISPLSDQWLINPLLTNPAIAGTSRRAPLCVTARQQMHGMSGAPTWGSISWNKNIGAKKQHFNPRGFINKGDHAFGNIGVGAGAFAIKYGAISQIGIFGDYSYHVFLGGGRLSMGIAPMYHQYIIDKSGFIAPDGTVPDPLLDRAGKEILHFFDVNAGIHYFTDRFFAGASVVQLFNSSASFGHLSYESLGENFENPYLARSLYVYSGITPHLGDRLVLEPSIVLKYNEQTGMNIQTHIKATINENLQLGLLYHYHESTGFFAGLQYGDLLVRFQYELPLGTAIQTRFSSYQIMAGYLLQ